MIAVLIALAVIVSLCGIAYLRYDPLSIYEPLTDEELLLLTLVDESYYPHLMRYIRTLVMSSDLQEYLKDKRDALQSISYFMKLQAARKEQEKKDRWENERADPKHEALLSHNERMILNRLRK